MPDVHARVVGAPQHLPALERPSWSLRTVFLVLVPAMAVPLLTLAAVFGWRNYISDRELAEERLAGLADATAAGVHEFLESSHRLLRGLSVDPHIASLSEDDCPSHFPDLAYVFTPVFADMGTWRADGSPVCSILPSPEGLNVADAPGFQSGLAANGFNVSPVQRGRRTNLWSTVLTYPIRDGDGTVIGLVSAAVDLVRFQEILAEMLPPPDGVLTLTQADNVVVARSQDPGQWVGGSLPIAEGTGAGDNPDALTRGFRRSPSVDGPDFSWAFSRVRGADWVVYAGRPTEEALGPVWALRRRLLAVGGLVAALTALFAWSVYSGLARPLREIVSGIRSASHDAFRPLPEGGPLEVTWIARQFNEAWAGRIEAEEERARVAERLRLLVEDAVTGICVSSEDGRFLDVNTALVDLLGYESRTELLATPVSSVFGSEDAFASCLQEHEEQGTFRGIPRTWYRKDLQPLDVRLFGRRRSLEGEYVWEFIVDDVTELTRLQAQYLQAQKMEALGRLAGGIAHDFNNILTVVKGTADMLLENSELSGEDREQVQEIETAADRGGDLSRQLLAFGRRTAGTRRALDPNEVIRGFHTVLRRVVREEVVMRVSLTEDVGAVLADRSQLEQVLMNLAVNATDAMPAGGELHIETYGTEVSPGNAQSHAGARPGPHIVIAITDTGLGIPADVLPHIFDPFFSTKPVSKGTGLGLATVFGIVADWGGHIRVASMPGHGATFQVYLPEHDGPVEEEAAGPIRKAASAGSGVILLAEDEGAVRRLARRILQRAGYHVITAPDGPEALRAAESFPGAIDLLVSDVIMPGLRGHQLAGLLADQGRVRRVLFVSGYADGLTDAGPLALESWDVLAKPYSGSDLLDAVERMLAASER